MGKKNVDALIADRITISVHHVNKKNNKLLLREHVNIQMVQFSNLNAD